MATERHRDHDADLATVEATLANDSWSERLAAVGITGAVLGDVPAERTVERVIGLLDRLAADEKWEVRKAVVAMLVEADRPAVRPIVDRLARDENRWVRSAAERAKKKLARVTTPAEKRDRKAGFAFDVIQGLPADAPDKVYEAALLIGEKHYEELAADMGHELNSFRTSFELLLEQLERRVGAHAGAPPDVGRILVSMRERSDYLRSLVTGLIDYARESELVFEIVSVRDTILEALGHARDKAKARTGVDGVTETLEIPAGYRFEVCRPRMVVALTNVLSNALEAMAGRSKRELRVVVSSGKIVKIRIEDTGCGMKPDQVVNAAKRFKSLRRDQGGLGLGLPFAVKIIQREHVGRLEIESVFGTGTTVRIDLPARREA